MHMVFRTFGWSFAVTAAALVVALVYGGPEALVLCLILGVLEISLSFDNAVVNATVLGRMSPFWQKIFLTVGIVIAVFGMRLVFPLLVVGITARLNPVQAINLAMEQRPASDPTSYAALLTAAHPQIAVFGGMFLALIFINFVVEEREHTWLTWLERPLARAGKLDQLPVTIAGIALVLVATLLTDDTGTVMVAGVLGIVTYLVVNALNSVFEAPGGDQAEGDAAEGDAGEGDAGEGDGHGPAPEAARGSAGAGADVVRAATRAVGTAGFSLFLYLEVLDASFSFDGVIGAFAITSDPVLIALGLGLIGAMFVRSLTVFLVRQGTLSEFVYLEHGAHWAIGALAAILLLSVGVHVDEVITGLIGVAFIGASLLSSIRRNRRIAAAAERDAPRSVLV